MFGDTEKARLPENWQVIPFSDLACINPPRRLERGEKYPYIPMEALDTSFSKHANGFCRVWKGSGGAKFQNGDVLLARITPSAENGKTAIVDVGDKGKGFGSTELIVMVPKTEASTSRFIYYLLKYDVVRQQAIGQMTGSTGRQRIPADAFEIIQVLAPPLEQQRKIAAILESVDNAIEKTQAVIDQLKTVKRGLMQKLFAREAEKHSTISLGLSQNDWQTTSIGDISTVVTGGTPSRAKRQLYFEGGSIPWVKTMDLNEDYINSTDECITEVALKESNCKMLPERSVLLAMYGGWEQIGRTGILRSISATNQAISAVLPSKIIAPEYLLFYLQYARPKWRSIGASSRKDPNITKRDVEKFQITFPKSLEAQNKVVTSIASLNHRIFSEQTKKAQLEVLKRGLMQGLLSGRMAVTV